MLLLLLGIGIYVDVRVVIDVESQVIDLGAHVGLLELLGLGLGVRRTPSCLFFPFFLKKH